MQAEGGVNGAAWIVARVLIASVFVGLGAERILTMLSGAAARSTGNLIFSAFELAAGLLIMIGWRITILSSVMALFLIVDAILSHPFWAVPAAEFHGQWLHFLKNMSAIGGLSLLALVSRPQQRG